MVDKRDALTGRFMPGTAGNVGNRFGGGRPKGTPNKSEWIRQQLFEAVDADKIKALAEGDPRTFWAVITKLMPKHVQAEVSRIADDEHATEAHVFRIDHGGEHQGE